MAYESLEISVTCEGCGTVYMELEDFDLADSDAEALGHKIAGIDDIEGLLQVISDYCDGYPGDLIRMGKTDKFIDSVRDMDFDKLKTLEFHHFTSDFDAPVDDPPLEISFDLVYDFAEKKAMSAYSES